MRFLFVANRMPYPPFRGDKLKIYHLAKELSKKHELHLITIAETEEDISYVDNLKPYFKKIDYVYLPKSRSILNTITGLFNSIPFQVNYFKSKSFQSLLDQQLETFEFDAIHVQHIRMSQFLYNKPNLNNVILDLPDAFSLYWKRRANNSINYLNRIFEITEYNRVKNFEINFVSRFKKVLVCSHEDQIYLQELGLKTVDILENGVDTNMFKPSVDAYIPFRVLFTGNMDYAPNIDAVTYFASEIWPKIIQKVPNALFVIAGQRPVPKVLALKSDTIQVTGFIQDLTEEYSKAHIVVSPLRIGAGTQNKVLEALSMNIPVVTTHVGYKGLGLEPNQGALLSTNADEFAQNAIRLLSDPQMRDSIGKSGGEIIRNRFSWNGIAQKLENYFLQINNEN
jgi:sugar transferase (PEP-CTERM/EpsH1 system associated)